MECKQKAKALTFIPFVWQTHIFEASYHLVIHLESTLALTDYSMCLLGKPPVLIDLKSWKFFSSELLLRCRLLMNAYQLAVQTAPLRNSGCRFRSSAVTTLNVGKCLNTWHCNLSDNGESEMMSLKIKENQFRDQNKIIPSPSTIGKVTYMWIIPWEWRVLSSQLT